ncbi:MAG: hypothetical protein WBH84_05665 [Defluviitoga tunisiensis]|jgi:hypothetical protein|uniref:Uncharacterized protein n=1 Tax=Defluviitoga tunisiensis TaxID=1006576 RepID=A0A0C7NQP8_DEFTU|nr:hypothetical protein [Defluviitoga tunisiensis]MDD3601508.1 hypothetical protein [Defluviitoga tunisiensis]MDY0379972.1 hypothetical protein [Defluviitoga tunisiensis]CEP78192.1 hypothetical protein DTL3_0888 [Defluviitoga tunisiensis]HHV01406.1 hypothetical protein [Defluviitoga tunisiensis]HOB55811.1 hypothetical protein [Defluviitoga tunisiensis]
MEFHYLLFSHDGDFVEVKDVNYQEPNILVINDSFLKQLKNKKNRQDYDYIGYFLVEEDNNDLSGIVRHLKVDSRGKGPLKAVYTDHISDMVRELYGDFVEIISRFIGLRKVIASFNELIVENNILNSYDFWLENIIIDVDFDQQDLIAQRVTKFVNLYLIRIYEGLFRKNIDLLKKYESQITYKILETGIMQKIL